MCETQYYLLNEKNKNKSVHVYNRITVKFGLVLGELMNPLNLRIFIYLNSTQPKKANDELVIQNAKFGE